MDFVPPSVARPQPFSFCGCPVPQETKFCGLYNKLGLLLTWVPPAGGTSKRWACRRRVSLRFFPALGHLRSHFLIFWQWLLPSKTTASVSSPCSMAQGLSRFRKLHFLPFAFHAGTVITSCCCNLWPPHLPFWFP